MKSLEESQNLLKTMEVDLDKMANLALNAEEIQRNQDEVQRIYEDMAGN